MKKVILTSVFMVMSIVYAQAQCTVVTACNSYSFSNISGASASASIQTDGTYLITISDDNGNILAQENCFNKFTSVSCSVSILVTGDEDSGSTTINNGDTGNNNGGNPSGGNSLNDLLDSFGLSDFFHSLFGV